MRRGEREREFLPLIVFWGVWSQYHGVFEKIGYAIKLNIVMLEWSSTQLWSPDAIWKQTDKRKTHYLIILTQLNIPLPRQSRAADEYCSKTLF